MFHLLDRIKEIIITKKIIILKNIFRIIDKIKIFENIFSLIFSLK